jgi:hypothetical protein
MRLLSLTPDQFRPDDVIYAPDGSKERLYRVLEVRKVQAHRTIVHVLMRDGSALRELPNSITYPVQRP